MAFSAQTVLSNIDQVACRHRWTLHQKARKLANQKGLSDDQSADLSKLQQQYESSLNWVKTRKSQQPRININQELPIGQRAEEISKTIQENQVVILAGETGSGKTTQLPKICLKLGRGTQGLIGHTQPRRLAARAVSNRIAEELNVELGTLVGCQVRFHEQLSEDSQVKLMTDGILLAEIQKDRFLTKYDTIIIDEAHERTLNIDFLLGYLKRLLPKRKDLKLIITSATIDVERFSEHFDNAPVIEVSGRTYPVQTLYRPLETESPDEPAPDLSDAIVAATEEILYLEKKGQTPNRGGDILVFLPGEREIREAAERLRKSSIPHLDILPLYARLSNAEQQKVFADHSTRRVVLATNVAETSITVPGVGYVIDPGLARVSRYSYRSKVQRLPIEKISQASANQRLGRCGRVSEGLCIRLYSEEDFNLRSEFTDAEILRTNLASVILQLLQLKLGNLTEFPLVDRPDNRFVKDGYTLLKELRAVNQEGELTQVGRKLARLPIDPRLGRMVLEASNQGSFNEVLIIVSALAIQDPRERPQEKQQQASQKHAVDRDPDSDFISLLNLWNRYEEQRQRLSQSALRRYCKEHFIHYMRMREWRDTHRQLLLACKELKLAQLNSEASYDQIHRAILSGLLSQIALHKEDRTFTAARGRVCIIHPSSSSANKRRKWIMAAELVETTQLYARTVAKIEPGWVEPLAQHLVKKQYFEPHWEKNKGQVMADEQVSLFGLIIVGKRKVHYGQIDPEMSREIFIQSALVEQNFQTKSPFWMHNLDQIKRLDELESKSRKRNILVDDSVLFGFYDHRLPAEIVNKAGFEDWLKQGQHEQSLRMSEQDLLQGDTSKITKNQFPDKLQYQGMWFPLSYHFVPGDADDGVSIHLPVEAINLIPESQLDWLVPGMLRDKCIAMVKALPKAIRKNFVPVPDFIDAALQDITPYQGSLSEALSHKLLRMTGVKIPEEAWEDIQIEDHHRMNIKLMGAKGKILKQTRHLNELRNGGVAIPKIVEKVKENIKLYQNFPDLELPIEDRIQRSGIELRVYPALQVGEDGVRVNHFDSEDFAANMHLDAILWLLQNEVKDQCDYLLRQIREIKQLELLYAPLGKTAAFRQDILAGALFWGFVDPWLAASKPLPRSLADWQSFVENGKGIFFEQGMRMVGFIHTVLKQRNDIGRLIRGKTSIQMAFVYADIQFQMDQMLYSGFARHTPRQHLEHFPRYFKAIQHRLDRSKGVPVNEQMVIESLKSYWQKYLDLTKRYEQQQRVVPELQEFRWMLEEYRVSLFAQNLGTQKPVSAKRIDKLLAELPD